MKAMLMQIAVIILNIIYLPFLPVKMKNKITILSRQSDKPSVDIKLLKAALDDKNIETRVLTKRLNKSISGCIEYCFHMLVQMYHIATSKLLVLDGYCILASTLRKKKGQQIVQMWHSLGAIKKFGYQSVGKPSGNSETVAKVMRLHEKYDFVIAPSRITAGYYSEAFNMPENKIKLYGLPRIDYLLEPDEEAEHRLIEKYPQLQDKENILYVPTFRRNSEVDVKELIEKARLDEYNLIIRKHWLDKTDYSYAEEQGVIVDKHYSFMNWLKFCRKVITDYSAAAFEAAILKKELYFYIKDEDEYEENIGLNMNFAEEEISMYTYTDAGELWDSMGEEYDQQKLTAFREKYVTIDTNKCTENLVAFLRGLLEGRAEI